MCAVRMSRAGVGAVVGLGLAMLLPACAASEAAGPSDTATPNRGVTCTYPVGGTPARPVDPPSTSGVPNVGTASATVHFAAGDVTITLDQASAPCTVNSFLSLAGQGFYADTRCHRLVDTGIFILQCGDPTATGSGGPGYSFPDELTGRETYPAGTVAMANRGPDTNGSQFFLVWADSPLPPSYTVFGRMDKAGLAVIQGIASQGVDGTDGISPIADASISSVTLG